MLAGRLMSAKVFISYRRDDRIEHAGRVLDRITSEFGREPLFMDVDAIPLDVNFASALADQVMKCDVVVAIVGPNWLDATYGSGKRRIDDPADFVRIEISAALKFGIPVISVFLEGAQPPKLEQLPGDIRELALRHGLQVRHASFHSDMDKLIDALRGIRSSRQKLASNGGAEGVTEAWPASVGWQSELDLSSSIDYDKLIGVSSQGKLGAIRNVMAHVARSGLPGNHHFYIGFGTSVPGVILPDWLAKKYPDEIMMVLQHEFWNLDVQSDKFSVVLTFDNEPVNIVVPFAGSSTD